MTASSWLRRVASAAVLAAALCAPASAQDAAFLTEQELDTLVEVLELQSRGEDVAALTRLETSGIGLFDFQARVADLAYLASIARLRSMRDALEPGAEVAATLERTLEGVEEEARAHFAARDVAPEQWTPALDLVAPQAQQLLRLLDADSVPADDGTDGRTEDDRS